MVSPQRGRSALPALPLHPRYVDRTRRRRDRARWRWRSRNCHWLRIDVAQPRPRARGPRRWRAPQYPRSSAGWRWARVSLVPLFPVVKFLTARSLGQSSSAQWWVGCSTMTKAREAVVAALTVNREQRSGAPVRPFASPRLVRLSGLARSSHRTETGSTPSIHRHRHRATSRPCRCRRSRRLPPLPYPTIERSQPPSRRRR